MLTSDIAQRIIRYRTACNLPEPRVVWFGAEPRVENGAAAAEASGASADRERPQSNATGEYWVIIDDDERKVEFGAVGHLEASPRGGEPIFDTWFSCIKWLGIICEHFWHAKETDSWFSDMPLVLKRKGPLIQHIIVVASANQIELTHDQLTQFSDWHWRQTPRSFPNVEIMAFLTPKDHIQGLGLDGIPEDLTNKEYKEIAADANRRGMERFLENNTAYESTTRAHVGSLAVDSVGAIGDEVRIVDHEPIVLQWVEEDGQLRQRYYHSPWRWLQPLQTARVIYMDDLDM